jgi:hypothetical protein
VTDASVAADLSETLDVHGDFTAKITFHQACSFHNVLDACDFLVGKVTYARVRVDISTRKDLVRCRSADTIDIGQTDLDTLVSW